MLEARLLSSFNKHKLANQSFTSASLLAPVNIQIWSKWGESLYNEGKLTESIEKYEHMLSLLPNYWDTSLKNNKERTQARLFFKHNSDFRNNFLYLARAYFQLEDSKSALEYLQFADQNYVDTLTTYGVIYGKNNHYEKALEYYQKAADIRPNDQSIQQAIEFLETQKNPSGL